MIDRGELIRETRPERRALPGRGLVCLAVVAAVAIGLLGCRSTRTARDTTVFAGDTLHGRIAPGGEGQAFVFEGVESSLLDFTVQSDRGNAAAPLVTLTDPEGAPLDLTAGTKTSPGSATMRVVGVVLPKTGTYKVYARPERPGTGGFYSFRHELRYAPMPDTKAHLSAQNPRPVYVSAPRGGLIAFSIKPEPGSNLVPDIQGVEDPWGGPALDRSQVPKGSLPPRVSHSYDGKMVLTFVAPRPGVYKILAAARPGREGVGTLHVDVRKPRWPSRVVYHGDTPARGYGLPAPPSAQPPAAPSAPPPPPPPPARPSAAAPPSPPVDPAIAAR
jgi:hypothetical protein